MIFEAIDDTTLFIAWDHADSLEVTVLLMNGIVFPAALIEAVDGGFAVSGLSRHVEAILTCGRPFARIGWHRARSRAPNPRLYLYEAPHLLEPERVVVEPAESEQRVR